MDGCNSEGEARRHIAEIRTSKRLDGPESNTSDLENALIILSEQLYQKATHFLLELIQNADDNTYNAASPTVNITFSGRTLRIDCNETGFSKGNIEAICKIGQSTKTGLDKSTRYIGEKGIGFKSVFKIADVVWISSGHYSFKFDKHARLGMIAPIWATFPEPRLPGYTSMYLQLVPDCDTGELLDDIKSLDTRLLIFLRKLRQVNIKLNYKGEVWSSTLGRQDISSTKNGENTIKLNHNSNFLSYRIVRRPVTGLPPDPKRPGCSESEILLAFPLNEHSEPLIATQNVYAFLPIRDYGFKFLLQADFLLSASREMIDSSSRWNRGLLKEIPYAFRKAVDELNKGALRYSWMRYLTSRSSQSDFFGNLEPAIVQILEDAPILESLGGNLTPPSRLRLVPESLSDNNGLPLIQSTATKAKYLSPKYSLEKDKPEILRLGVRKLMPEEFIVDLKLFIEASPREYHEMDQSWHSCLCKALFRLINDCPQLLSGVLKLEIVPLKDGRWRSANRETMCFSDNDSTADIPKGISIVEIDPHASSDYARRSLYIMLGAQSFSNDMVCKAIISTHAERSFRPQHLSQQDLISHVAFLYHAGWKNFSNAHIWLLTESGSTGRSCDIYIDSDLPYSATDSFKENRERFSFVHRGYFEDIFTDDESLKKWMVDNLLVAEFPRIVPHRAKTMLLSDDFQYILEKDYLSVLLLLRDHWSFYTDWISHDEDPKREAAKVKLRESIARIEVVIKGGGTARLKETMLPLNDLAAENMMPLSFIDLPDPENRRWRYLSHFGVVVNAGAGPFIQCLQLLKEAGGTVEQASELYKQILLCSNGHEEAIRKAFTTERLIFVPRSHGGSLKDWINFEDCVWDGPQCLQKTPCIRDFYPEHSQFFCFTLGLSKANWRTLMDEAQSIEAYDSIDYISDVFISINDYLEKYPITTVLDARRDMIATLIESSIFPIDKKKSQATFDYLSTAQPTDVWFIADRWHLKQTFEGLIPLLALKVETLGKIAYLIKNLGWEHRLLSRITHGVPQTSGHTQLHSEYTNSIGAKARYIARLIPTELPNRVEIISQLANVKVYTAEKVSVQWTLKKPDSDYEVVGRADSGRVKLTAVEKVLEIYLRKGDADVNKPPFELREELTTFCGVNDPDNVALLHWVVSESNIEEIEAIFSRRGLQNDVPELEVLRESLNRGQNPHFWDKGLECNKPKAKRNYHSKPSKNLRARKARDAPSSALDAVQNFMSQFNSASSWSNIAAQPWKDVGVDAMLSHLCRLENRDPHSLLRQNNQASWDSRLRRGGAFPDDAVGVFFEEDPLSHQKTKFLRPAQLFPAVVEITKLKEIRIHVTPAPTNEVGEDIMLAGEVYVSKLFEREMGQAYRPEIHWTSYFRNRSGLDPFRGDEKKSSTFTIKDDVCSYAFTQLLIRNGYKKADSWPKNPTYHIEVSTTEGNILSEFTLDPWQVHKAWLCHKEMSHSVKDVFILIRISDVRGHPEIALFVDPWKMHADGKLLLAAESRYLAEFETTPPFITLKSSSNGLILPGDMPKKSLKLFSRKKPSQSNIIPPTEHLYNYQTLKLQEIRLLELFPGQGNDPISGSVKHVSVKDSSNYSAISYVWGPALKPFYVQTAEGKIPLTTSLRSALKRIRNANESVFLWADAICIDQSNDFEKALQIRMLPTIFQSAETVFAWIGNEQDDSHKALETLMQIRTNDVSPDEWPEELPTIPYSWRDGVPPARSIEIWKCIATLFEREWFRRVWVIQEAVLAAEIKFVCGAWDIDWDDVFSAIEICIDWSISLDSSDNRVREMLAALKPAYTLGLTRKAFKEMKLCPMFNLLSLLDNFAHTEATKECDKMFALLGISSDAEATAFNPDYQSPVGQVARRYAAEFIQRGSAIDILYRAGLSKSYDFASWIPNWTSGKPCRTISTWRGADGVFSAGGSKGMHAQIVPSQPNRLQVNGTIVDRIIQVGETTTADYDVISVISSTHEIIDKIEEYPTGESKEELRLKVPIGNAITPCSDDIGAFQVQLEDKELEEYDDSMFNWNDAAFDVNSMQDMVEFLKQNRDARDLSWKYWSTVAAFLKRLSYGRFCVTNRGYIGFAPYETKVGDLICVFDGGAVPFVLREASASTHKLVGECYIHGIMYGESDEFDNTHQQDLILE